MITPNITKQIAEALKAKDEVRLSTLRMLSSALNYEKIDKRRDLTEEEEIAVVKKEAKKRNDAIEAYTKAGAKDRADLEGKELSILKEYLPEEMSESELSLLVEQVIKEVGAKQVSDMGRVIGVVMQKSGGRADGSKVAAKVKEHLGL